jgi:hypothetical protein
VVRGEEVVRSRAVVWSGEVVRSRVHVRLMWWREQGEQNGQNGQGEESSMALWMGG